MILNIQASGGSYPVIIEKGAIKKAAQITGGVFNVPKTTGDTINTPQLTGAESKAFIVTDSGIPSVWRDILRQQFPGAGIFVFPEGERSKNLSVYKDLLTRMLDCGISRNDFIIALGGGVVGDLAGFAAATYMRGIRYINIPTTTLSQIDSSIGGKTGLDLEGVKNALGAFHHPAAVIIDPDVLDTLPQRQFSNGMAEAVKAGLIRDPRLFELFEKEDPRSCLEEIIFRSLTVKKDIIEADEFESGERKLLNYGHSFGHAYESIFGMEKYLHGECVAMGMMTVMENAALKERLRKVLEKLGLPTGCSADPKRLAELMKNDKKTSHGTIDLICVDEPGKGCIKKTSLDELLRRIV